MNRRKLLKISLLAAIGVQIPFSAKEPHQIVKVPFYIDLDLSKWNDSSPEEMSDGEKGRQILRKLELEFSNSKEARYFRNNRPLIIV